MFELENITNTILSEIAMPKLKQSDIAKTYALAIVSDEKIDWSAINQAIITRWSRSGLNRVKQMAWHIIAPAQQNAHPTLGKSADLKAVSNTETLSTSDSVPQSAPVRVA